MKKIARSNPQATRKPTDYEKYKAKRERAQAEKSAREERSKRRTEERKRCDAELAQKRKIERDRKRAERAEADARKKEKLARIERERDEKARERAKLAAVRAAKRKKLYAKAIAVLRNKKGGFDYDNYGIRPRVGFEVRGDGATLAARFSQAGIALEKMTVSGGFVRFKIRKKDCRKAIAILNEMCYTYKSDGTYGVGRLGAFVLVRAGLLIGAAASVVALNVLYSHVWRVEIDGNERLSRAAVASVLQSSGVGIGLKKSELDCDAVAALVGGIDGVSDASCEIVGTTLKVYVLESKEYVSHDVCGAYYSDHDATVTRIVVRSGTAKVERGTVVKAGELLVDGNVYSTAGELLYSDKCDAEVYGEISVAFTAELGTAAVEYRRTGKTARRTEFELFGYKLFGVKPPFASYESVKTTANYDVLIPLYVSVYEFFETEPVAVERDVSTLAAEFAEQKAEELEFIGEFDTQISVKESVSGLWSVHVFLSGEVLISRGGDAPSTTTQDK